MYIYLYNHESCISIYMWCWHVLIFFWDRKTTLVQNSLLLVESTFEITRVFSLNLTRWYYLALGRPYDPLASWFFGFPDFQLTSCAWGFEDKNLRSEPHTDILLEDTLNPSLTVSVWEFLSNCGGERGSLGAPSEGTWAKSLREDSLLTSFPACGIRLIGFRKCDMKGGYMLFSIMFPSHCGYNICMKLRYH